MNLNIMSTEYYELYLKAVNEVSSEHPYRCFCGRLCTGLHERNCSAFQKGVERRYLRLLKKRDKDRFGVDFKVTVEDEIK